MTESVPGLDRLPANDGHPYQVIQRPGGHQAVTDRDDMATAVFHGVNTDHAHMSGALYVQPSMPPSPPWKVTGDLLPCFKRPPYECSRV